MLPRYHHHHHHHHHHHSYYYYRFTCQLDVFPKTPSGKLDKKVFPDPEGWTDVTVTILDDDDNREGSNGITTVSSIVLQIIERINGVKLSASSSFASIGIDSLAAVLLLRNVSLKFGNIRIEPKGNDFNILM